jgi:hypothetical protein
VAGGQGAAGAQRRVGAFPEVAGDPPLPALAGAVRCRSIYAASAMYDPLKLPPRVPRSVIVPLLHTNAW